MCVCERFWSASLFISFSIHVAVLYCFDPQHIGSSRNHENGSHGSFLKRAGQTFMLLNYVKSIPLLRRHPQMYRKRVCFLFTHSMIGARWIQLIIPPVSLPSGLLDGAQTLRCPLEGFNNNSHDCCSLERGLAPSGCWQMAINWRGVKLLKCTAVWSQRS